MKKSLLAGLLLSAFAMPAAAQSPAPTSGSTTTPTATATGTTVEAKKAEPVRFYGFGLDYSIYDSTGLNGTYYTNTLDQLFQPSWSFGRLLFDSESRFSRLKISGRFSLSRALAGFDSNFFGQNSDAGRITPCGDLTPSTQGGTIDPSLVPRCDYGSKNYRWDYGDILLTVSNAKIVTIPVVGIDISPSVIFTLPTSIQSRFATLRMGLGASVGLSRTFWDGKFGLRYSLGGSVNFHQYTTKHFFADATQNTGDYLGNGQFLGDYATGNPSYLLSSAGYHNSHYGLSQIFGIDVNPTDKLSFSVLYVLRHGFKYDTSCIADYGPVKNYDTCASGAAVAGYSGSGLTNDVLAVGQVFWATVGYQITDWLNASVALITTTGQKKDDNSLRQPFIYFDANGFSTVSMGLGVSLEKAAAKLF